MVTKRIIPCLDVKDGRVVKGTKFINLKDAGDPVELAAYYDQAGADELVFLDITASCERRKTIVDLVRRTAEQVNIPFTVGGGIGSLEDIREILKAGADKVSLNTAAVTNPDLIAAGAEEFGSRRIIVAIDASLDAGPADWVVYARGGRARTGLKAVEWAARAEELGAGEILLTSIDADGRKEGYDLELTKAVTERVKIPVIASGGAGNLEHIYNVLTRGKADAALAASIFHFGIYSVAEVKKYLKERGVEVYGA
ncbi:MAG TPA: imidazole glycerol phosphate synthase subunit HisF [Firmicutes bacterium]|nr:imidazole glycerol phosphate synthase subunit HisF [Bacillota bacterium]